MEKHQAKDRAVRFAIGERTVGNLNVPFGENRVLVYHIVLVCLPNVS